MEIFPAAAHVPIEIESQLHHTVAAAMTLTIRLCSNRERTTSLKHPSADVGPLVVSACCALGRRVRPLLGVAAFAMDLGCSDGARIISSTEPLGPPASGPGVGQAALGPLYALETSLFGPDDSVTSYVTLTGSLDIEELTTDTAREFSGYSFISTVNGRLLVSDGESPTITSYDIGADLSWNESARVNFGSLGVSGGAAGFERHWFLDPETAYLTLDVTERIVWSPSEMVIKAVMAESSLVLERDGLQLDATFNRQPRDSRGPILKPFYYRDEDWFLFGPTTSIAVYDPVTHEERSIIDVPCPSLEVPSQDEAGNTYFSTWTYGPVLGLYGLGPETCVRRIKPDSSLDESWAPDLAAWTGGNPVNVFRYMRDGKAVGTVLHVDEAGIDFSRGYDEEDALALDSHWRLWLFDLESETARPIDGVEGIGAGFFYAEFDGRAFVSVPNADWSRSSVFEIGIDGTATKRFESTGFINDWIRVR